MKFLSLKLLLKVAVHVLLQASLDYGLRPQPKPNNYQSAHSILEPQPLASPISESDEASYVAMPWPVAISTLRAWEGNYFHQLAPSLWPW